MSISAISGNANITAIQSSVISSQTSATTDADGDNDGSRVSRSGGGGRFASAIIQALAQLGNGSTAANGALDATSATSTTAKDPQQALAAFVQNLFAALQSQSSGQAAASTAANRSTTADASNSTSAVSGQGHHHHHGGGAGKLEGGLQNLIQQLASSADASATGTGSSTTSSANPALDALQQSFDSLLAAEGKSGSNATLSDFLKSFAQNLQGAPSTGNVVSTKV
jgi:hypothetical protein